MNRTDAVVQHREVSREIIYGNNLVIRNLDFKELAFIEENLDYYEKVSLMFLLCADDPKQRKFFLNELITLSHRPSKRTDYLKAWVADAIKSPIQEKMQWKHALLESLCLIQAKRIIFELGLNIDELIGRYLPLNLYVSENIHGTAKRLYKMCENMTVDECTAMVNYMKNKYPNLLRFVYSEHEEYLELHLMHWLSENVISLGERSDTASDGCQPPYLQPLVQYFKENEMFELKEIISNGQIQSSVSESKIVPTNESQTDDNRNTMIDERPRNIESLTLHDNDEKYLIRPDKAGIILIINQRTFVKEEDPKLKALLPDKDLEARYGTDQDAMQVKRVFTAMHFIVEVRENLTNSEILMEVKEIVSECTRKAYDSIFICILSHGADGVVYGSNSIPVNIEEIKTEMMKKLIGKPKVLIIQACQGTITQRAIPVNLFASDGIESIRKPICSDILTCVASVKGFTSIRHINHGSWFIQTLCEKIIEFSDQMHFLDILTKVHGEVQEKRGNNNECMVPELSSSFGRFLFLPKIDRAKLSEFDKKSGWEMTGSSPKSHTLH